MTNGFLAFLYAFYNIPFCNATAVNTLNNVCRSREYCGDPINISNSTTFCQSINTFGLPLSGFTGLHWNSWFTLTFVVLLIMTVLSIIKGNNHFKIR
jgi:hypothetical protein